MSDVEDRLADVERRLSALEEGATRRSAPAAADDRQVDVLAVLGSADRIAIVLCLIARGPQTAAAVQEVVGLASTGRLYHHLKTLIAAGVVTQRGRADYRVADDVARAVLEILDAASRIAAF